MVTVEKGILNSSPSHPHSPAQNSSGVITIVYFPMYVPHSKYQAHHNEMYIYTRKIRKTSMQNHPQSSALHFDFLLFIKSLVQYTVLRKE